MSLAPDYNFSLCVTDDLNLSFLHVNMKFIKPDYMRGSQLHPNPFICMDFLKGKKSRNQEKTDFQTNYEKAVLFLGLIIDQLN